jgi:hypothetical protein
MGRCSHGHGEEDRFRRGVGRRGGKWWYVCTDRQEEEAQAWHKSTSRREAVKTGGISTTQYRGTYTMVGWVWRRGEERRGEERGVVCTVCWPDKYGTVTTYLGIVQESIQPSRLSPLYLTYIIM